jgi:hypothetical protein
MGDGQGHAQHTALGRLGQGLRDIWRLSRRGYKRVVCLAWHWHMVKVAEVTTRYQIKQCRTCGLRQSVRLFPAEGSTPEPMRPIGLAVGWYRHHTRAPREDRGA